MDELCAACGQLLEDCLCPKDLWECPHCQSHWGIEEIDFQECDACGWPDVDEQYIEHDDYDDEPDSWVFVDPPYDDNPF